MKIRESNPTGHQDLYSNLIHLYVLHHACRGPTFGLQVIEELARLDYKVSPGTMYPLLIALEKKGLLRSRAVKTRGTARRIYRATAAGRKVYTTAKEHVEKLLHAISPQKNRRSSKSLPASDSPQRLQDRH
jgi:PadR family transcriptional regulator, regulatory protein PadR